MYFLYCNCEIVKGKSNYWEKSRQSIFWFKSLKSIVEGLNWMSLGWDRRCCTARINGNMTWNNEQKFVWSLFFFRPYLLIFVRWMICRHTTLQVERTTHGRKWLKRAYRPWFYDTCIFCHIINKYCWKKQAYRKSNLLSDKKEKCVTAPFPVSLNGRKAPWH